MIFQRRPQIRSVEEALGWLGAITRADVSGDPQRVADGVEAALQLGVDRLGREVAAHLHALRASCLMAQGRYTEAMQAAREAGELGPLETSAQQAQAQAAFRAGEFETALAAARALCAATPRDPFAWHLRGRIELWLLTAAEADASFQHAVLLAPQHFATPFRVTPDDFDRRASEAYTALPAPLIAGLDNVIVRAFTLPPRDDVRRGIPPDLLGLYTGPTVAGMSMYPARIALYQLNIETVCGDSASLDRQIRRVVMHEVGHHFHMDHDELRSVGL
jgi:predicted Zn-dependent protease with MMP-like domain